MKRTTVLALLLAYGSAHASEWVSMGKSNGGNLEAFVDASSIRAASGIRRAWVKFVLAPQTQRDEFQADKWVNTDLSRVAFNCREGIGRREAVTLYYEDGTNYSTPPDAPTRWQLVVPDTEIGSVMHFICTWKLK